MNSQMTENRTEDWIANLEQAQALLLEAWQLISDYCQESGDRNTQPTSLITYAFSLMRTTAF